MYYVEMGDYVEEPPLGSPKSVIVGLGVGKFCLKKKENEKMKIGRWPKFCLGNGEMVWW